MVGDHIKNTQVLTKGRVFIVFPALSSYPSCTAHGVGPPGQGSQRVQILYSYYNLIFNAIFLENTIHTFLDVVT